MDILHVYQADQLNFRQGVGVWNIHPLGDYILVVYMKEMIV
jgi:hypothetical protein